MEFEHFFTPEKADIFLTYNCDLKCPFCYYRLYQQRNHKDIPIESWLKLIDELKQLGVMRVLLVGGEPLVYPGLSTLIEKIVASNMRFQVITNGVRMRSHGKAIIENAKRCDSVQISIDGMEETHDSMRGQGNWAKSIDALRWVKENGIKANVNSVISSKNLDEVSELVQFLVEDVGISSIRTNCVNGYDDAPLLDDVQALNYQDMAKFIRLTSSLADRYPQLSRNSIPLKLLDAIRVPKTVTKEGCYKQCLSLRVQIAFRADGEILPCLGCENVTLGNIRDTSVLEVWKNSPILHDFRKQMTTEKEFPPECMECKYNYFCSFNCPSDIKSEPWCVKKVEKEIRKLEEELRCQII